MFVNMKTAILRNAIFLEKPDNSHVNTLTLIFNAEKLGDPNALTIAIHNVHPTLGRQIERSLKTMHRTGTWKRQPAQQPATGAQRRQVFNGTEWLTTEEKP